MMSRKIAIVILALLLASVAYGQSGTVYKGKDMSPFDPKAVWDYCVDMTVTLGSTAPGTQSLFFELINQCAPTGGHGELNYLIFIENELQAEGILDMTVPGPFLIEVPLPPGTTMDATLRILAYGEYVLPFGPVPISVPIFELSEHNLPSPGGTVSGTP